jgi:hypothetical protein
VRFEIKAIYMLVNALACSCKMVLHSSYLDLIRRKDKLENEYDAYRLQPAYWLEYWCAQLADLLFVLIILHPSYIAYGTSAIFSTTFMVYTYALASILYCEILLAVLPLPSRHGFRAQRPPTFLSLLCCITSLHLAILLRPFSLSVSLVKPLNVPQVDFVVFGSRPLAYFGLLYEFEHVHYSIICEQGFEFSSVWRFADRHVFGFQLLHHGLSFSAPLSALEQEVRDGLSAAAALPAACVLGFTTPR